MYCSKSPKEEMTNAQEKAYISPVMSYLKHSKLENTDLIMLLQHKLSHSLDFRITIPGVLSCLGVFP